MDRLGVDAVDRIRLAGARIALQNSQARGEIEALVRRVEKVETTVETRFQEHFVDAIAIPHTRDPYPRLERVVPLPERVPRTTGGQRPRRRRRSASGNHRSAT